MPVCLLLFLLSPFGKIYTAARANRYVVHDWVSCWVKDFNIQGDNEKGTTCFNSLSQVGISTRENMAM